ncbi:HlyD family efflux transporter periplasmic adaptor subunit [Sulfidibacter corallicola]|uniref:HlyD family efflux transporter periplasmic adaptor subunit n=1 Tax=Sulfidibacter corallicola TaxID=2818388 RepID=A0A8A4THI9_SULCO|nr:HlyD family efflux transporter periplasmic adaptor subunit [Sulfidibacter corallicola]QTD49103.1 HlyD family efflux transporter periplasmic adaptor subunit [Sulfidibacter corallicola]
MDIPRGESGRRTRLKYWLFAGLGLSALIVTLQAFQRPESPLLERENIWTDTVKRGLVIREIRGTGSLQARNPLWVTALSAGRVHRVFLRPGVPVEPDTLLLTLTNPHLEQAHREAQLALQSARSDFQSLEARLERERVQQSTEISLAEQAAREARLDSEAQTHLHREGVVSEIVAKRARIKLEIAETKLNLERTRADQLTTLIAAERAAARTNLQRLEQVVELRYEECEALTVRAGTTGLLQQLPWESGRQVSAGDLLALIAKPDDLRAELSIPETRVREIVVGQPVRIDTRGAVIRGRVERIDPVARNGAVRVDVALPESLPAEARLDLTVDGVIELERLESVLHVSRPAFGAPFSQTNMFRLADHGNTAERVTVTFGAASVRTIEIKAGLSEHDRVILSDTSKWPEANQLRLR